MKGSRLVPVVLLTTLLGCGLLTIPPAYSVTKAEEMAAREHINKGNFFLGRRQFSEALQSYEEALRIEPTSSVAKDNVVLVHNNWGIHYFQQRKFEEAEKEWRQALSLDSTNNLAKHNIQVLKQTLARQGLPLPSEAAAQNPEKTAPKKGPSSSVTILTPGLKQSTTGATTSSGTSGSSDTPHASSSEPAPPASPAPTETPPAETGFDTPPTSAPSQTSGSSFEDQITGIEVKVYGRRQPDLSVIKRLEKIETDTTGQVQSGTIKDRIDRLRRSYGL